MQCVVCLQVCLAICWELWEGEVLRENCLKINGILALFLHFCHCMFILLKLQRTLHVMEKPRNINFI